MPKLEIPERPWRRAALSFSITAFLMFIINLSFTLWASTRSNAQVKDGIGVLSEQSCANVKKINTSLHILINIISATLLAGSNYCMQCVMAPNRSQIDAAHEKRRWLDIGIPSFRNFSSITWTHKVLWILLGISSVPLHLLYNSTIIASTSVNQYWIYMLDESVLAKRSTIPAPDARSAAEGERLFNMIYDGTLTNITLDDFIDQYGQPFQSTHGTIAFVLADEALKTDISSSFDTSVWPPALSSYQEGFASVTGTSWICQYMYSVSSSCDDVITGLRKEPLTWVNPFNVATKDIRAIYSQTTEEHCKLLISLPLCWAVIALNLFKSLLMFYVAFGTPQDPLLTIGDAVASFLQRRDPYTESMCLKPRKSFARSKGLWDCSPERFEFKPMRKFFALRRRHLFAFILLMLACLAVLAWLLAIGIHSLASSTGRSSEVDIGRFGLGAINIDTLLNQGWGDGAQALMTSILLANLPQAVLSIVYVGYNSLFTSLCVATEWNGYGLHRKGLRVTSKPLGAQRETYFLQLPYRWSLPLVVTSGMLHWLISQSIFVVILDRYMAPSDDKFALKQAKFLGNVTCGWSPLGVILVIVGASVMTLALLASAYPRLPFTGMPVASSNSAAISAACHVHADEKFAWEKPLKWGEVESVAANQNGHCSFSSERVETPQVGKLYE